MKPRHLITDVMRARVILAVQERFIERSGDYYQKLLITCNKLPGDYNGHVTEYARVIVLIVIRFKFKCFLYSFIDGNI